jgi:uncharacterized membrane protein YphA (DoxX/SURF4 family)
METQTDAAQHPEFSDMVAPEPVGTSRLEPLAPRWSLLRRIGFRFCFLYFGLFCVLSQPIDGFTWADVDPLCAYPPVSTFVSWTAAHVFNVTAPLVFTGSGSGDKVSDWVFHFLLLVFSVLGTGLWSALDRKRGSYDALYKWFRLFIRFALAGQLITYGLSKVIPEQMPYPSLTRLVEPYGHFSPMGALWFSIGAAQGYEIFAGCAELLGGILLVFPRTALLGALIGAADMTQVFALNMTFDVPVKILSFHLLLLSLFVLAPDLGRLLNLLLFDKVAGPSTNAPLFGTLRANRIALAAQIVLGIYLVAINVYQGASTWNVYGGGAPKSPLYGIWNVENFVEDGRTHAASTSDKDRWRRVIFDDPDTLAFQRMDDFFVRYRAAIKLDDKSLTLTKGDGKKWKARYTFRRQGTDRMLLDGTMDGHKIAMQLRLMDRSKMLLVATGFHWMQEYPFNR